MKELFVPKNFKAGSLAIIDQANVIIKDYQAQGFTLTLRQLYYQFVARDLIENKQTEYKRLGSIVSDARLAGLIDWDAIEDRTRFLRGFNTFEDPAGLISDAASRYKEDLWETQEFRPEVWIEKDALIGVIEPACNSLRVNYFACRGYASQSEHYSAGQRFSRYIAAGQKPIVFHLGDHDPSGIDMTRDNQDRITMFAESDVEVVRIALNFDQVQKHKPPPNPAKETDSRSAGYIERFGSKSWELDALDPRTIDKLLRTHIEGLLDDEKWSEAKEKEAANREKLDSVSDNWEDVANYVEGL